MYKKIFLPLIVCIMFFANTGIFAQDQHGWEYISTFRNWIYPSGFVFTSDDEGWIAKHTNATLKHILNGGEDYESIGVPGSSAENIFFVDPDTGWVVGDEGYISKTCDGGESWDVQHSGDFGIEEMEYPVEFKDIEFINSNEGWAVGGYSIVDDNWNSYIGQIIVHTTDGGENWEVQWAHQFTPLNANPELLGVLWTVTIADEQRIIVGLSYSEDFEHPLFLATENNGERWRFYDGLPHQSREFIYKGDGVFLGLGSYDNTPYLYISENYWESWEVVFTSDDLSNIEPSAFAKTNDSLSWVACSNFGAERNAILQSIDDGESWQALFFDDEIGQPIKVYSPSENLTYALFRKEPFEFDLYKYDITNDVGDSFNDNKAFLPEISIFAAYPNPFNSSTTITYGLRLPAPTRLALYDLSGREVRTLFDGYRQAGFHSVNMNAGDLASGLYFVKLEGSGQIVTQKVMLIK